MAGRIRTIKPELREHLPFASLSDRAARLFTMLFTLVDDEGRCPASPAFLSGAVFFARPCGLNVISRCLGELEEAKLVHRYTVKGAPFLVIEGWRIQGAITSQKIEKPQPSRYPAPDSIESPTDSPPESATHSVTYLRPPTSDLRPQSVRAREVEPSEPQTPAPPVAIAPIAITPPISPEALDRRRRATRLAEELWIALGNAHARLRGEGIDPHAPSLGGLPGPESKGWKLAVERCTELLDFHDLEQARVIAKHRLDFAIAEARAREPQTLMYFSPPSYFSQGSWETATSRSLDSVTARAPRGPRSAREEREQTIRVVRDIGD